MAFAVGSSFTNEPYFWLSMRSAPVLRDQVAVYGWGGDTVAS
jgi:hypothetical protein